jgi:hypothetical protein
MCDIAVQFRSRYGTISQPLQYNFAAVAVQFRSRYGTILQQLQYNLAAVIRQ